MPVPTTIEATVIDKLATTAAVTALVGTDPVRIYPGRIRQGVSSAAISVSLIFRERTQAFGADQNLIKSRLQFSCYGGKGESYDNAKAVAAAVVATFCPAGGQRYRDAAGTNGVVILGCEPTSETETFDAETEAHGVLVDFYFWHRES